MVSWLWGGEQPDVCLRDMKAVDIDTMSWEGLAADRTKWRSALKQHLKTGEDKLMTAAADKRGRRMEGSRGELWLSGLGRRPATGRPMVRVPLR